MTESLFIMLDNERDAGPDGYRNYGAIRGTLNGSAETRTGE